MALLGVMAHLGRELGLQIVACGVDHGMRPEASAELDLAERCASRWAVPFERKRVEVKGNSNLQALARDARYAALGACAEARGLNYIVTAHHLEDRAETVLLRLLRGAGPEGLRVLPPRLGNKLRPLIRASKSQILAYLEKHEIPWAIDPSNDNRRFSRVRVRHELLPLMRELSPGIVDHLNNLADELGLPPLPTVTDEQGRELMLNRSQRALLRKALESGQNQAEIWLSEARSLVIDPNTNQPRVVSTPRRPRGVDQNSTPRATKSSKSN
jgi:tRNA(Ile)-lysidine synthase